MVASRQVEIPFFRGIGRQRRRGFSALAQVVGRKAIPLLTEYIIAAAKRAGAVLMDFVLPETADVVSDGKKFKTAAKSVGSQTLRKQLGSGSRKMSTSKLTPVKSAKQTNRSRGECQKTFFINYFEQFLAPTFCGSFRKS